MDINFSDHLSVALPFFISSPPAPPYHKTPLFTSAIGAKIPPLVTVQKPKSTRPSDDKTMNEKEHPSKPCAKGP